MDVCVRVYPARSVMHAEGQGQHTRICQPHNTI